MPDVWGNLAQNADVNMMKILKKTSRKIRDLKKTVDSRKKRIIKSVDRNLGPEVTRKALATFLRIVRLTSRKIWIPRWPDVVQWDRKAVDGHRVKGWHWSPSEPAGSIILCHGFRQNSFVGPVAEIAKLLKDGQRQVAMLALNFRSHGPSTFEDYPPALGEAERWDIEAAVDHAESNGFPTPYVLIGYSLGAMAASRFVQSDRRAAAAFLIAPPYKPLHGLKKAMEKKIGGKRVPEASTLAVASAINYAYSERVRDILRCGDIRKYNMNPPHLPHICYWIGRDDHYGVSKLRDKIYRKWYDGELNGEIDEMPGAVGGRRVWFVTGLGKHQISTKAWDRSERSLISVLSNFLPIVLNSKCQSSSA